MSNSNSKRPHVVIVGGGFGGLALARGLKKLPVDLTLIDRNNHHLFQPLLYQVATAGLSPAEIAMPIRHILHDNPRATVIMAEVTGVDGLKKSVCMRDRSLSYDYLILATGARHSYFGHNEWETFAPGLKSIEDATTIRRNILLAFEKAEIESDFEKKKALLTFVIVGAGPTGVEMAGAIAELARKTLTRDFRSIHPENARIILVEAGPHILSAYPEDLSQKALTSLKRLGVEVWLNSPVEAVDESGAIIKSQNVSTRTVIWAAGVQATPVGRWLGITTDRAGRVSVNPDFSIPNHPDVFVIGDAALYLENGQPLPGVAPAAKQAGEYLVKVLQHRLGLTKTLTPFHYKDKGSLATIGRARAIASFGKIKLSGFFAWILWLFVHILYLTGFRNKLVVLIQWAWSYLAFQRGARLITFAEKPEQPRP